MNRTQASRKGFARQQNNSLFFKDSKSCLGCPDMRTLLDTSIIGKNYTYSEHTPSAASWHKCAPAKLAPAAPGAVLLGKPWSQRHTTRRADPAWRAPGRR